MIINIPLGNFQSTKYKKYTDLFPHPFNSITRISYQLFINKKRNQRKNIFLNKDECLGDGKSKSELQFK